MLKGDILFLHLEPDGIGRFLPPLNIHQRHASIGENTAQISLDLLDQIGALAAQIGQARGDGLPGFRIHFAEGKGLQLRLQRIHADAFRQRGVDFQRFARLLAAAFRLRHSRNGPHIMQPIRELDQQHADILAHREHKFAEILSLFGAFGLQFKPRQLGDAIHQPRHFLAEAAFNITKLERRILNRVMQ